MPGRPLDLVTVAVVACATEALQSNGVGVSSGMREKRSAVAPHEDRHALLVGRVDAGSIDAVVLTLEVDHLTVEEVAQNLHAFGQTSLARCGRGPFDPGRVVLAGGVPGTESQLEATTGDTIDRRGLPCELHRIAHVVVEHQRAQPDPFGRRRDRGQRRHRRPTRSDMIRGQHDVEAQFLGPYCRRHRVALDPCRQLVSETQPPAHGVRLDPPPREASGVDQSTS